MDIHNNLRVYERLSESREKVQQVLVKKYSKLNKYIEDHPK